MDDFSCVSVLKGEEAKEQRVAMHSWKTAANNSQLLVKTSDGKGQVVEIIIADVRGATLVSTVFITPPYFSSEHMIVTASSLTVFATNGAFLRYKLNFL